MSGPAEELAADALRRTCAPESFSFETTAALPALTEVLGQPRAVAALELGAAISSHGFNLFALGQPGSGRTTLVRDFLEARAANEGVPGDLCFVFNFADSRRPLPLRLPAGRGTALRSDMDVLIAELQKVIPRAFETEEYAAQRDRITGELEAKRQDEVQTIERNATESGFRIMKSAAGFAIVPHVGGKPLTEEAFNSLPKDEQEKINRLRDRLQHLAEERMRTMRELEKQTRSAVDELDQATASYAVGVPFDELRARYRDLPSVLDYLNSVSRDVISNVDDFRKPKENEMQGPGLGLMLPHERPFVRYRVNLLVDNRALKGAPVVIESNPTYHNLTGRIEHHATLAGTFTDHTMIKAGALHRANGGYLLLPARECLLNPFAWEALKRALKDRAVDVEELGTQLSMISTVTLDPEPVPLDVKVVLIGSPLLYYLLSGYDEDFPKLFKVKAEFATRMARTREAEHAYAVFVSSIAMQDRTLPFDRGAVARIVEYGSRIADDQDELSTRFGEIADLVREAAHRASRNSHAAVAAGDVRAAEQARRYRNNLVEERLLEEVRKGTLLFTVAGSASGRINGLTVLGMPEFSFGHPVRITAAVAPGRKGVASIEREVKLSGPIHGKGVLILGGYLLRQYGAQGPLNLSASLVFEQSYGMVEGDSASMAELCVLLSALSGVPLRQDIAVTGSINQHGDVQAVGGVTEKVEGYFRTCQALGLTGTQGVLLPASNRRHLMLDDEVVEAVRSGKFHLWSVEHVDSALELLTEQPAEAVHGAAAAKLKEYGESLRAGEEVNGKAALAGT
jgi:lon-related putative ATP-dependent protease